MNPPTDPPNKTTVICLPKQHSVFLTDACMIYAPSQIALAAVIHAASRQKQNLES